MDTAIICDRRGHIVQINLELCCQRAQDPKYHEIPYLPYYWEIAQENDHIVDIKEDGTEIYCVEISETEREVFKKLTSCKNLLYYNRLILWQGKNGKIYHTLE